jgi:fluoride exporter
MRSAHKIHEGECKVIRHAFERDFFHTQHTRNTMVLMMQALAVALGAAGGALLRWAAGLWLTGRLMGFPLSTLLVNSLGGLCMGMALVWFERASPSSANTAMRLLITTGFLGGLTTFSAFSAESFSLMRKRRAVPKLSHPPRGAWRKAAGLGALLKQGYFWCSAAHVLAHVLGALCCVWLGSQLMKTWTSS